MSLPLTKAWNPRDYADLTEELQVVDQHFTKDREQHPERRWEYALALRAQGTWLEQRDGKVNLPIVDVGGDGSPFWRMAHPDGIVHVVDPAAAGGKTLADYLQNGTARLAPQVFCLSVLEHVDDLDQFLYHLSCLVAPGGLLFLTMDGCDDYLDDWPVDSYMYHWMRTRIFNHYGWRLGVREVLYGYGFGDLGAADINYHGAIPGLGYTFYSVALVKRS